MTTTKIMFAAVALIVTGNPVFAQDGSRCPTEGVGAPLTLHEEWIMEGWERRDGDPAFDFATRMGKYYDLDDSSGVFWDNFAPGDTQLFDDASIYGPNWTDLQNSARSVLHGITDGNHAIVGDNVASTTLGFVGRLEKLTGEVIAFDARSQLGWTCAKGTWKIKQELNYAWVVDPQTIEPMLGKRMAP